MSDDNVTDIGIKPERVKPKPERIRVPSHPDQWKSDLVKLASEIVSVCFVCILLAGSVWVIWWVVSNLILYIVTGGLCGAAGYYFGKDTSKEE